MAFDVVPVMSKKEFEIYILENFVKHKIDDEITYAPDFTDLFSLYSKVRNERTVAILEFGSGWSTFALAKALEENYRSYARFVDRNIRHPNPYTLMTIDASSEYQNIALNRIPKELSNVRMLPVVSKVNMSVVNGQACHLFHEIPPFTADFVYLDGPDCDQVQGDIHGMTVRFGLEKYKYGLPMAGDLLLLEPYFWPGTTVVTDGRGANANFLKNNFRRNWLYGYEKEYDQHSFSLREEPFGKISNALLELKMAPHAREVSFEKIDVSSPETLPKVGPLPV